MNDLKSPADNACAAKALLDLLGCGVGGDIEIFGFLSKQEIADCPAYDVSIKASLLKPLNHVHCPW